MGQRGRARKRGKERERRGDEGRGEERRGDMEGGAAKEVKKLEVKLEATRKGYVWMLARHDLVARHRQSKLITPHVKKELPRGPLLKRDVSIKKPQTGVFGLCIRILLLPVPADGATLLHNGVPDAAGAVKHVFTYRIERRGPAVRIHKENHVYGSN